MLAQDELDESAKVGSHVLAQCPIDGDIAAHGLDQFAGDVAQTFIAEHLDGAVTLLELKC